MVRVRGRVRRRGRGNLKVKKRVRVEGRASAGFAGAGGRWAGEAARRGIFDRGLHGERGCGGPERGATGDERGGAVGLLALAATRAGDESDCDGPPRRRGVAAEVGG